MRIIAHHAVVQSAERLGWETVRCDVWECTDNQAAAYMVDDNELSNLAEDDEAVLAGLLVSLQDTDFPPISFDEAELDELLGSGTAAEPFDSEGGVERVIHKRLIAIVVDEVLHGELIAIIAERYPDLAGNEAVVKLLSDASQKT